MRFVWPSSGFPPWGEQILSVCTPPARGTSAFMALAKESTVQLTQKALPVLPELLFSFSNTFPVAELIRCQDYTTFHPWLPQTRAVLLFPHWNRYMGATLASKGRATKWLCYITGSCCSSSSLHPPPHLNTLWHLPTK